MRILFFGTPEFAAASLELIAQEGFNVVAVVTAPDKPAGRGRQLKSSDVKVGISIEPIKYYYDKLPNKKNVIKLNKGISDQNGFFKFFCIKFKQLVI